MVVLVTCDQYHAGTFNKIEVDLKIRSNPPRIKCRFEPDGTHGTTKGFGSSLDGFYDGGIGDL